MGAVKGSRNERDRERRQLRLLLGDHGLWWWRLLWQAGFVEFLIPAPAARVWAMVRDRTLKPELRRIGGQSAWLTFALVAWAIAHHIAPHSNGDAKAGEFGRQLFTGAFLLGTLLSVSNALPGQTMLKSLLAGTPSAIIHFAAPLAWSLMMGFVGACSLTFIEYIPPAFNGAAHFLGIYGACMEVHALAYTFRLFLLGLVRVSEANDKVQGVQDNASEEPTGQDQSSERSAQTTSPLTAPPA